MVTTGFGSWISKLPNADALHRLAVWEIFCARTELSLDGIEHSGKAMFIRWKSTLMLRITQDFTYAFAQTKAVQPFHTRWLQVSNQWYHFDPGENELSGKLSFLNSPNAQDSHTDYLIEHSQMPQDDDTSDALLTTTSNGHSQGSQNTLREN
ncbi:hypothetical protein GGH92_008767 [Coemansia sp. RSA 2673]|nr:hypothetical protein GGH92_008767 [Coemansia sp. RSA 2673]